MKKIIISIITIITTVIGFAQNVSQAEYFWDTDPGEGSGISMLAFDGNFNSALESVLQNNASLPAIGNHVLGIRVKGSDGNWGAVFRRVFRVGAVNNTNVSAKLTQAEYFWDTDPGEGSGISMLAFDGNFNSALESVLQNNASLPAIGNHVLGIRVKGSDGNWGAVFRRVFRVGAVNNSNVSAKLTQAEYFWDTDPGEGAGISMLAFDGNFNSAIEDLSHNTSVAISQGLHLFNVRVKGVDGNWGEVYSKVVGVDLEYSQVELVSPLNNSIGVQFTDTLKWNLVTGGSSYYYEYSTDSLFSSIVYSDTITDTVVEINGLSGSTKYFWRVQVRQAGKVGLWSDTWSFTTSNTTSIADLEKRSLKVYPNPSNDGIFNLEFDRDIKEITVYNASGRIVYSELNQNHLLKINLSEFKSGIYILKIKGVNNQEIIRRLIKN